MRWITAWGKVAIGSGGFRRAQGAHAPPPVNKGWRRKKGEQEKKEGKKKERGREKGGEKERKRERKGRGKREN